MFAVIQGMSWFIAPSICLWTHGRKEHTRLLRWNVRHLNLTRSVAMPGITALGSSRGYNTGWFGAMLDLSYLLVTTNGKSINRSIHCNCISFLTSIFVIVYYTQTNLLYLSFLAAILITIRITMFFIHVRIFQSYKEID